MKHILILPVLLITLLVGTPAFSGDLIKGLTAYDTGDYATALREWTPLAEQGASSAQYMLGQMYRLGEGVPQDYKTAVKWYRLAAKQGSNPHVQFILGYMHRNAQGVPQDYKAAMKWYLLAAEQGLADAQYNLGLMYDKGDGVPQDYKTAVKWYRLAAEQGNADAQLKLALMYALGNGVIQDDIYAHMWANLAASNGSENGGKVRSLAAQNMTPADLSTAQNLARECVAKNYKGS